MLYSREPSIGIRSRMDWTLAGAAFLLVLIGSVAILSSSYAMSNYSQIVQKHSVAAVLGVLFFLFGYSFNYQIYQDQAKTLYILTLILMALVLLIGVNIRGHRSWIRLPYFNFQPSEFARVATVLVLANYLDRRANKIEGRLLPIFGAFMIVMPVMALILAEPDFGSALVYFPLALSMLFCAGAGLPQLAAIACYGCLTVILTLLWVLFSLRPDMVESSRIVTYLASISHSDLKLLLTGIGLFGVAYLAHLLLSMMLIPFSWFSSMIVAFILASSLCSAVFINHHIKEHQRNRFVAFLAPQTDPQGVAYNVNQALVAIGSGGMVGKGIFSATQSQLGFLPERHTDFIFGVIGEEMGFLGSMVVLILYLTILWRMIAAARSSRDHYGYLVCCGLASMLGFYLMVNVGMCLGLVPVAGIPLPMVSYGGSSLVMTLWMLGIASNIYSKRHAFI